MLVAQDPQTEGKPPQAKIKVDENVSTRQGVVGAGSTTKLSCYEREK